ncbi:MAG: amidohydrolase, partial [Sphingobacteriia bacterium]|nr:amidohydrolase [Sphingobacteriia bacterium]
MLPMKITVLQADLIWEDPTANLLRFEEKIRALPEKTDLIILPEMFSTGFSMAPERTAESHGGSAFQWMQRMAKESGAILCGSLAVKEDAHYYNRLYWVQSDGSYEQYDKRHLFSLGHEDRHYTAGKQRLIVELNGWKICPTICYDLRFPAWLRNNSEAYELLLVVANWPAKRALHWRTLIPTRAIENQSYVIGLNRYGHDGNEVYHSGDSMCIDPNGNTIYYKSDEEDLYTFAIYKKEVERARRAFPFLKDADD